MSDVWQIRMTYILNPISWCLPGEKVYIRILTGGPWGTFDHVEAWRNATELLGAAARMAACLLATLTVESILAE